MSRVTLRPEDEFKKCCELAHVHPTARQRRKFTAGHGAANAERSIVLRKALADEPTPLPKELEQ